MESVQSKQERIKVDVMRIDPIGHGRLKVKVKGSVDILDLNHNGRAYEVIRNLGRGRYIMREIEPTGVMSNGRYQGSIQHPE